MKSVVITGSSRGLGFEMAKRFLELGANVTLSGRNPENLAEAARALHQYEARLLVVQCDVRDSTDVGKLWDLSQTRWGRVDIWVNNAGVNQPNQFLWEISHEHTDTVIRTNLVGTLNGSQIAMRGMMGQGGGFIYNMEGFGSSGALRKGLNLYGTTKRAVTYFSRALAKEAAGTGVKVGCLSPGMMATDFITKPVSESGEQKPSGTVKRIFNILGDRPEVPARFLVAKMLDNEKNDAHFAWLTGGKAAFRFAKAIFVKRNLFD